MEHPSVRQVSVFTGLQTIPVWLLRDQVVLEASVLPEKLTREIRPKLGQHIVLIGHTTYIIPRGVAAVIRCGRCHLALPIASMHAPAVRNHPEILDAITRFNMNGART